MSAYLGAKSLSKGMFQRLASKGCPAPGVREDESLRDGDDVTPFPDVANDPVVRRVRPERDDTLMAEESTFCLSHKKPWLKYSA